MLARMTDRIIVLSEQQLHEIRDEFRIGRPEQFAVVPLGIDFDELRGAGSPTPDCAVTRSRGYAVPPTPQPRNRATAQPNESEELPHGLVVGIVGRVTAIKNHDLFLRVAARCHDLARFVVYGDGADRAALEQRAANVTFAGTRKASEIYAALDVVALTSRNEGTPLALIEAMACGKPVISTAVGGVVDLLGAVVEHRDGFDIRERGITAASDDAVGFSAGLAHLLRDVSLRRALSERGREYVERVHSKERLVADILTLYRDLLR
jgi:glycosyltransferase involved in cell wall biosynthesis